MTEKTIDHLDLVDIDTHADKTGKRQEELQALADSMLRVATAEGANSQDIFFAAALIVSWTLSIQTDETRGKGVNLLLNMIRDGREMFSKNVSETPSKPQ